MGSEVTILVTNNIWKQCFNKDDMCHEVARRDDFPGVLWLLHFRITDWMWNTEDAGGGARHNVPYLICNKNRSVLQFEEGLASLQERFPQTNFDFEDELGKYNAFENFGGYIKILDFESIMMNIYFGWYPWNDLLWKQALLGIEYPDLKFEYTAELVRNMGVEQCSRLGIEAGTVMTWQGALRRLCVPPPNTDDEIWLRYCNEESSDLIGEARDWYSESDILGASLHYEY